MQNQQQPNLQSSEQIPPRQNEGGHALFDTHEAIGSVISVLEQHLLYKEHMKDQELLAISQQHHSFMTQMYNTLVDTLKTGQNPAVPTQTYKMQTSNEVIYGMKQSQPKSPSQSVNEITDECVSGFMLGGLKSIASSFTLTALEATNPVLRRIFADSIPNVIEMAYEVFLYQNKHQYYQVPQLQAQDMQMLMDSFAPAQGNNIH